MWCENFHVTIFNCRHISRDSGILFTNIELIHMTPNKDSFLNKERLILCVPSCLIGVWYASCDIWCWFDYKFFFFFDGIWILLEIWDFERILLELRFCLASGFCWTLEILKLDFKELFELEIGQELCIQQTCKTKNLELIYQPK